MKPMGDEVRQAVERLFSACLELTLSGKGLAFFEWSPHIQAIEVWVYDPVSSWREGAPAPALWLNEKAYVAGDLAGRPEHAAAKINALNGKLYALLKPANAQGATRSARPAQGSATVELMTMAEVASHLRRTRSGVDKLRARDPGFPKPLKDGDDQRSRIWFVRQEIESYLAARLSGRRAPEGAAQ